MMDQQSCLIFAVQALTRDLMCCDMHDIRVLLENWDEGTKILKDKLEQVVKDVEAS